MYTNFWSTLYKISSLFHILFLISFESLLFRKSFKTPFSVLCLLTPHLDIIMYRITNSMQNLFLVYFVNLYMFRAYVDPTSGSTTVCIQQLVLIILFRWLSVVHWTTDRPFTVFQKQAALWTPLPYTLMSKIWCSRDNNDEWHCPKRRQTPIRIQGLTTQEADLNLKFRFLYFSSAIISHDFSP